MMGSRLWQECIDHMPAEVTQAQINLMLYLAMKADHQTRIVYFANGGKNSGPKLVGLDVLAADLRCSKPTVQKALKQWRDMGIELRIPIGQMKGKRPGVDYHAGPGHVTRYKIPDWSAISEAKPT